MSERRVAQDYRRISDLKLWKDNPRNIKPKDFERLKKQIQELGQYKPLLITPDGEVIGGNMRLRAYKDLGIEDVWVSVVDPKSEAEKLKYALSDNDRAGYYDDDLLANLSSAYPGFDWASYAVDLEPPRILSSVLRIWEDVVEDDIPDVDTVVSPNSEVGEVYILGNHRLMCGDSTKAGDIELLMGGKKSEMVFTDPPYGMSFDGSIGTHGEKRDKDVIVNDEYDPKDTEVFLDSFLPLLRKFNRGAFYITYWRLGIGVMLNALERNDLKWRNLIIWKKNNFNLSNSDYKGQYEPVFLGWGDDYVPITYGWVGDHSFYGRLGESDIWEIDKTQRNDLHSTMKPVKLCARAINNSSNIGDVVLDLFGGSGSTLVACEQLNRTCYMMEIDPKYCDVIRKRYAKFVGRENEWQNPNL